MALIQLIVAYAIIGFTYANYPIPEIDERRSNVVRFDPDSGYRLNYNSIRPIEYTVTLFPNLDTDTEDAWSFEGRVSIVFRAFRSELRQIIIHKHATLTSPPTITLNNNPIAIDSTSENEQYEFLIINLVNDLLLETDYVLNIAYIGNINLNIYDRGFYGGYSFKDDGTKSYYAVTQFQPTHARKAFPCFDEPKFKAVFNIIIHAHEGQNAYSNMPEAENSGTVTAGRRQFIFKPTPVMSSYLIAFYVGEFVVTKTTDDNNRLTRIIARPNAPNQSALALELTSDLTEWLSTYLGLDYFEDMGDNMKNDQISIPDFPSGAMENWGLVVYREPYLLFEDEHNTIAEKSFLGAIIAHELAHKWFGNLVTCHWWSNTWLNEAYASHFENFATHAVAPELAMDREYFIRYYQQALIADQVINSRSLHEPDVNSPTDIWDHFSTITYAKGASLLRMLEVSIGEIGFRDSLRYYLSSHKFQFTEPEDMYNAFSTTVGADFNTAYPNSDIATLFQGWVDQPGYPVIDVAINHDLSTISLTQRRFLVSGQESPNNEQWQIPITFTTDVNSDWEDFTPAEIMIERTRVMNVGNNEFNWVVLNKQRTAYYRVNYEEENWRAISAALHENINVIHFQNRAAIVDDVFVFMRAHSISFELGFHVLRFLVDETDYNVWNRAIAGFTWLRLRFATIPDALATLDLGDDYAPIKAPLAPDLLHMQSTVMRRMSTLPNDFVIAVGFILNSMDKVIEELGFETVSGDTAVTLKNRNQITEFACLLRHAGCIAHTRERFLDFKNNNNVVDSDNRRVIYCFGLQQGTEEDFELVWNIFEESNNQAEQVSLLRSLACTGHANSLRRLLLESTRNPKVRIQDRGSIITFIATLNRDRVFDTFEFLRDNRGRIDNGYQSTSYAGVMSTVITYIYDEDLLSRVETFVNWTDILSVAEKTTLENAIATSRSMVRWGESHTNVIVTAIEAASSAYSLTATISLLFAAIVFLIIK